MLPGAFIFLAAFALFLRTACPAITSGDGAELLLAGLHLDVTHPPGYPLLACLIRLALELPAGGLAFRAGLVAAVSEACAVAVVAGAVRALCGRPGAGLLAAALFAAAPYPWGQATLIEKYALQLALAAWVLRITAERSGSIFRPGAAWAIALTHHSLALFLAPVAAAAVWERLGRRGWTPRLLAMLFALAVVPFSLRLLYPAIRAAALHRDSVARARAVNWGEPYQARAWWGYHRLEFYRAKLLGGGTHLLQPSLRAHVGYYPAQLTWPGLVFGAAGLAGLLRRRPRLGAGLLAGGAAAFGFAVHNPLPPPLGPSYHQLGFLLLALGAGCAAGAGLDRLRGALPRWLCLAAVLAGLGARAAAHYAVLDGSRRLGIHDLNLAELAVAPPGAVLMAMSDDDQFALRCLQDTLGRRPDLVPLALPTGTGPRLATARRAYRASVAAALPGARLRFTDDDTGFVILRRLIEDNRSRWCFTVSALSLPAVPPDLFRPRGTLLLARTGRCPLLQTPGRALRAAASASCRTWFAAAAALPAQAVLAGAQGELLRRIAADVSGPGADAVRGRLLRTRARLTPAEPAAWLSLGDEAHAARRLREATACYQRAEALDPAAPEPRLRLLEIGVEARVPSTLTAMLRRNLATPPFAAQPAAAAGRQRLAAGDLAGAVAAARRVLAETALEQAAALPGNPEFEMRRIYLLQFAAETAPDWAEAQARCGGLLLERARPAEAERYVLRLRRLAPADVRLDVSRAAGLLEAGRLPDARGLLLDIARRNPAEPAGWFYLGQAEEALGDGPAATAAFERFLDLAPAAPQAPRVRARIAALRATP